ncbi:DUF2164 domain-containing protein [Thalassotalea sp. LPB0316]|uniref:DUF2164 domain-containing protein n=1 Tax=Thalassotalea sp. LPB0316 TaxID=2769490 RepID=UPI001868249E|nr:DUF2164 domain-containing protein [Thalassotalea sp. LPB0316]QOL25566.1 DUF2164 domain-containing protein [Thalassotalea sp. LPB0316]
MHLLKLNSLQKARVIEEFQEYFDQELGFDLGQFDVEFLLSFIEKTLGNAYYNKGLTDAQTMISARLELLTESIVELEQPSDI